MDEADELSEEMALDYLPAKVPVAGQVIGVVLQMSTFGVLCFCLSKSLSSRFRMREPLTQMQREEHSTSSTGRSCRWHSGVSRYNTGGASEKRADIC